MGRVGAAAATKSITDREVMPSDRTGGEIERKFREQNHISHVYSKNSEEAVLSGNYYKIKLANQAALSFGAT
jgi:hypothetical protein